MKIVPLVYKKKDEVSKDLVLLDPSFAKKCELYEDDKGTQIVYGSSSAIPEKNTEKDDFRYEAFIQPKGKDIREILDDPECYDVINGLTLGEFVELAKITEAIDRSIEGSKKYDKAIETLREFIENQKRKEKEELDRRLMEYRRS